MKPNSEITTRLHRSNQAKQTLYPSRNHVYELPTKLTSVLSLLNPATWNLRNLSCSRTESCTNPFSPSSPKPSYPCSRNTSRRTIRCWSRHSSPEPLSCSRASFWSLLRWEDQTSWTRSCKPKSTLRVPLFRPRRRDICLCFSGSKATRERTRSRSAWEGISLGFSTARPSLRSKASDHLPELSRWLSENSERDPSTRIGYKPPCRARIGGGARGTASRSWTAFFSSDRVRRSAS